jgi:hypothetical protein
VRPAIDWQFGSPQIEAEHLLLGILRENKTVTALTRIISSYVDAINDDSRLPVLNQAIEGAPQALANVIPNAKRVLEQKQDLNNTLLRTRSLLQ